MPSGQLEKVKNFIEITPVHEACEILHPLCHIGGKLRFLSAS